MGVVRKRIFASGRVQGVFYRASAAKRATALGLAGWVKNLPDGRVEALVEGDAQAVEEFIAWCRSGPPLARVTDVKAIDEEPRGDLAGFRTEY